jgi:hypothetical protein
MSQIDLSATRAVVSNKPAEQTRLMKVSVAAELLFG